jgi:alpha-L-fucosidase
VVRRCPLRAVHPLGPVRVASALQGPRGLPAEWIRYHEELSDAEYQRYFRNFDPDLYDPHAWAAEAHNVGHALRRGDDQAPRRVLPVGLGPDRGTRPRAPPAGRDLLSPLVDAFRSRGLRTGFYHSLVDWHHPQFPVDGIHPQRHDPAYRAAQAGRDVTVYAEYLHGQVRELLTRYGDVDIMWFDFSYPDPSMFGDLWAAGFTEGKGREQWRSEELLAMVRRLQPGVLVNDRLDVPGDFLTAEQYQPAGGLRAGGEPAVWEVAQTFNGSWGYDRDNVEWKSVEMLVGMLIDTVSKGGNLLLNVGPDARGRFQPEVVERLRGIGAWMHLHRRAIHGCGASAFVPPPDCRYTQHGDRLYLHLLSWPYGHVHLRGLAGRVEYAQLLSDGSQIGTRVIDPGHGGQMADMGGLPAGTLTLDLPTRRPAVAVPVVELFLTPTP